MGLQYVIIILTLYHGSHYLYLLIKNNHWFKISHHQNTKLLGRYIFTVIIQIIHITEITISVLDQPLLIILPGNPSFEIITFIHPLPAVQQSVQSATGLTPSVPQAKPEPARPSASQSTPVKHGTPRQEEGMQKDVLKTVYQLLQQSQGVSHVMLALK